MKRLRKWAGPVLAVGLGAGALSAVPAAASEETPAPLHVASEELQQEVRPRQKQWLHERRITVDQFANGRLVETVVWTSGKNVRTELTLGPDGRGRRGGLEWIRADERTLIRRITMESYVQTTEIVRTGETCTARLRYELRPGHTEFVMRRISNDERVFIGKVEVRRVRCWVGEYSVS